MKATKIGIWMDHDHAQLTEFTVDPMTTTTIESGSNRHNEDHSKSKGEMSMHTKEHQHLADYYKKLGELIRNYTDVLLFGPTSAKNELFNSLRSNHLFADIRIEVEQADKMTENQKHAFVKKYFSHN